MKAWQFSLSPVGQRFINKQIKLVKWHLDGFGLCRGKIRVISEERPWRRWRGRKRQMFRGRQDGESCMCWLQKKQHVDPTTIYTINNANEAKCSINSELTTGNIRRLDPPAQTMTRAKYSRKRANKVLQKHKIWLNSLLISNISVY